ncbi:MAG: SpoIIE family protein phosphatase [Ignavibacteriaceae bacterium]
MNSIKNIFLKYRTKIIAVVSLLLIALALVQLYFVLVVRVTSNDECLWREKKINKDSVAIFFDIVKVEGVTWEAGIRNEDQLIAINGETLHSTIQAQLILNEVESGDFADYVVIKDGEIFETKVRVKKLIQYGNLANSLSALFWMLIGFIVFTAKPDGHSQKLFYAIGVLAVLCALNVLFPITLDMYKFFRTEFLAILLALIWMGALSFIPFVVIYFFWTFPKPFKFVERTWVKRTIFITPAIITLVFITITILTFRFMVTSFTVLVTMITIWGWIILAFNIAAWISLIIQYRRLKTKGQKKSILLFIIAFAFGFIVTIYSTTIAPAIADSLFNSPEYFAPIVLASVVPLIFAYSIFKYQLMDVSVVIKNTIIYGTATVMVAAIYFLVIYVLGQSISSALGAENQGIVAGVFFIIFALIFQSSKNRFQDFLTKRFYPEQFAQQRVLMDLSNELATVVGLDNILELMKKTFVDALKINKFGILIRDENNNLSLSKCVGINEEACIITKSNIADFLKERSLITKNPAIEQADFKSVFPDMAEQLIEEEIYTVIPMIIKNKIVGLLLFGLKHSGSCFAGKDLELLWTAANQAAVSIENSRLYKTEVEKQKIERDLDLARKIQEGLLPACIPEIGNLDICGEMIPAMQVGGDYFDLLPVDGSDSKLFVVIGDVSGKGLSASLYMTKLQTMVQFACKSDRSPKEILVEINKRIFGEIERNWFITMSIAYFDLEKNTVKFCRAGHMPLLTATNGSVESYRTQGIGVGLEKGELFESSLVEEEIKLNPGQIYAFFTDGITEAMNEANELFGEEKLTTILKNKSTHRSSEIMNEIWQSLNTFRGTAEVNDDMTMVIVKVK